MKSAYIHYWNILLTVVATAVVLLVPGGIGIRSVGFAGVLIFLAIYSSVLTILVVAVVKKETAIEVLKDLSSKLDGGNGNG